MAKTVQDVYNTVCEVMMEPARSGTCPGLSLGIVTLADFLALTGEVIEDYSSRLGLVWEIFSSQLLSGISSYDVPEDMNQVKEAFVGGQNIDHSTLFELDQWEYQWNRKTGTPEYWYQDGLAPKTLGVALTPDYTGAGYIGSPTGTPITFTGTLNTAGTVASWVSGDRFQTSWNFTSSPALAITINSIPYTLSNVYSPSVLMTVEDMGVQSGVAFSITIPASAPPYGIFGVFNGATIGQYSGVVGVTSTAVAWVSGSLFDLAWNNYYPPPNISLSTDQVTYTAWPISSVADSQNLTLAVGPADGTYYFKVGIGNDGNLTMVGTQGLPAVTYTLDTLIPPTIPDSFVAGISYGVLARIFSGDSDARDMQRAAYCQARYVEYSNIGGSISGELVNIGQ